MNVLMLHNYYQHRGGEDSVFEAEVELLRRYGQNVDTLTFHNDIIQDPVSTVRAGLQSFSNPVSAKRLADKIGTFQPDIIHIHNLFPLASPSVLRTARKLGVPVVMTLHNFRLICANALLYREGNTCEACVDQVFPLAGIRHGCYRQSKLQSASITTMTAYHKLRGTWKNTVSRYISLNHFARSKILSSSLGLNEHQVAVKPNFVFDSFQGDADVGHCTHKQEAFVYVGRLSVEKSIDVLLDAFQRSGHSLKIIGSGPLEGEVRQAAESCPSIQYLGFQNRESILSILKHARALVLPSSCYENFPMTIIEAFSSGTPVITSRIGGLPDIVEEGSTGFLAAPSSAESLMEQCNRMLGNDALYQKLCLNAREAYLNRYTAEKNFEMLISIYNDVLAEARVC